MKGPYIFVKIINNISSFFEKNAFQEKELLFWEGNKHYYENHKKKKNKEEKKKPVIKFSRKIVSKKVRYFCLNTLCLFLLGVWFFSTLSNKNFKKSLFVIFSYFLEWSLEIYPLLILDYKVVPKLLWDVWWNRKYHRLSLKKKILVYYELRKTSKIFKSDDFFLDFKNRSKKVK